MIAKVAICLAALFSCALCTLIQPYPGLVDFGPGKGDDQLMDTSNPANDISLEDSPYWFYGKKYEQACVSDNGFVSLGVRESANTPTSFPIRSGSFNLRKTAIAAPYWSNVDLRCGGDVFYRKETGNPNSDVDLLKIRDMLDKVGVTNWTPKSSVIVTFYEVRPEMSFGGCPIANDLPRNTFQLVLTSDEISTYAIFIYASLQWDTGNGRGPATSGFNAGNGYDGKNVQAVAGSAFAYQVNLGQNAEVMAMLEAEMMMAYAMSSDFGVAEVASYEDLPAIQGYEKPLPSPHSAYHPAMAQEAGDCELYAYGFSSGDDYLIGSDTSSGRMYLSHPICFYGEDESAIMVYVNGYITFDDFFSGIFPPKFMDKITVPAIAPFYADGDARAGGARVFFRQTANRLLRTRAKAEIQLAYGGDFYPDTLYIATWDKIGYHNHNVDKQNTYQVVIASAGHTAYVLILYKDIQWTSPEGCLGPGGNPITNGLGAEPGCLPMVGLTDGNGFQDLMLSKPRSQWTDDDFLQLPVKAGNTGLNGVYAFQASLTTAAAQKSTEKVSSQEHPRPVDPKTSYVLEQARAQHNADAHRPSRPYVSKQWREDVNSLAQELGAQHG